MDFQLVSDEKVHPNDIKYEAPIDDSKMLVKDKCLNELLAKYAHYIKNKRYVYKLCCDVKSDDKRKMWIVIMQKIKGTKTNEGRTEVRNYKFAKFRANKLKVMEI